MSIAIENKAENALPTDERDLGPLAWISDEVRRSLEGMVKALHRFTRDVEAAGASDLEAIDNTGIRVARQNLHQVHGALQMVGADQAAQLVQMMEAVTQRFAQKPHLCTEKSIALLERSSFALLEYLSHVLKGREISFVALFPQYKELQALQGARAPLQNLLQSRLRRIAVLTGQLPSQWPHLPAPDALAPADGSVIPSQLPDLLPSDVLERRPDVRGAAQIVRAQAARLGSAKADLLPRFYLGFLANDGRIEIGDLATSGRLVSWGAGLRLPIFEGGRLRARIQASDAQLQAAVTQYEQAVLGALEDVENAYSTRRALDQRSQQVRAALSTAQVGARHAQRLFEEGNGLLQGAVEAQLIALQREDELIQAETARALLTVALYKAVGGGWPQPH